MSVAFPGEYFKMIHVHIIAQVDAALRPFGLTCAQSDILRFLDLRGEEASTVQDIGAHFRLSHPTVVGIVRRLEKKGFVTTAVSERDRRCRVVRLTERFDEVRRAMEAIRREIDARACRGLSADELLELRQLLERIHGNLTRT